MYSVRLFESTAEAYATIVALYGTIWPDERQFPVSAWQEDDEDWPEDALKQRFVVETNDRIVGLGACFEKYWQHQPGTVHIEFDLHPDHDTPATNQLLYQTILDFLAQQEPPPTTIGTEGREDHPERLRFLEERGYKPTLRTPRASLKLADFNKNPFQKLRQELAEEGIHIYTLAELQEQDPDWKEKLHRLRWAIVQDVPAVEPPTEPTLAEFEQMILDDPALDEEAWFIALDESESESLTEAPWIGMSNLWLNDPTRQRLDTGLTGVLSGYRRRGIATALKIETIEFGQELGATSIETDNEENNPMYKLNLILGFRPKAAWVSYRRPFPTSATDTD